jgi:hypothetical protein
LCQIEKSSKFKSGKYGGQSAGVQNSASNRLVVLGVWNGTLNLPKFVFSRRIRPLDPEDHMLFQKLLVDVGIDMFDDENRPSAA